MAVSSRHPSADLPARRQVLGRAALAASRAPSVHNSQPWRFVLDGDRLDVTADWHRFLRFADPSGRQLHLSCGCALFNARVAIAAAGYSASVELLPEPLDSALLARLRIGTATPEPLAELAPQLERRQTNRGSFADERVEPAMIAQLVEVANAEGASLIEVDEPVQRAQVVSLDEVATEQDLHDPEFFRELNRWLTTDPARLDGLPSLAPALSSRPAEPGTGPLLVLQTAADDPPSWLAAGSALERMLLELSLAGYAAVPLMQLIEIARTRLQLRAALNLVGFPHVVLRVGHARPMPATRRRRLADLIIDRTDS